MTKTFFVYLCLLPALVFAQKEDVKAKPKTPETTEDELFNEVESEESAAVKKGDAEGEDPSVTVEPVQPEFVTPEEAEPAVSVESDLNREEKNDSKDNVRLIPFYYPDKPVLEGQNRKGEKVYKVKSSPQKHAAGFRVGPFQPTQLKGDTEGIDYQSIYGKNSTVMVGLDYEYQLLKFAGKLGLRGGVGMATASGNGRFRNNTSQVAEEIVSLYVFDFGVEAIYRMQFAEGQILIPYGGAGGDYIFFTEYRSDKKDISKAFKYAGVPATHWLAGLQLQLDFLDREGLWQIDQEYGINHMYFFAGVRHTIGLSSKFDFTNFMYEGGILVEF